MKRWPVLGSALFVAALFCEAALAGQISGAIREATKPVVGLRFTVQCGMEYAHGVTDKRGRYRVIVQNTGRCRFEVPDRQAWAWVESGEIPTRQDFTLSDRRLEAR